MDRNALSGNNAGDADSLAPPKRPIGVCHATEQDAKQVPRQEAPLRHHGPTQQTLKPTPLSLLAAKWQISKSALACGLGAAFNSSVQYQSLHKPTAHTHGHTPSTYKANRPVAPVEYAQAATKTIAFQFKDRHSAQRCARCWVGGAMWRCWQASRNVQAQRRPSRTAPG